MNFILEREEHPSSSSHLQAPTIPSIKQMLKSSTTAFDKEYNGSSNHLKEGNKNRSSDSSSSSSPNSQMKSASSRRIEDCNKLSLSPNAFVELEEGKNTFGSSATAKKSEFKKPLSKYLQMESAFDEVIEEDEHKVKKRKPSKFVDPDHQNINNIEVSAGDGDSGQQEGSTSEEDENND